MNVAERPPGFSIYRPEPQEAPELATLQRKLVIQELIASGIPFHDAETWAENYRGVGTPHELQSLIESPSVLLRVIRNDEVGELAGYFRALRSPDSRFFMNYLRALYIDKKYWGRGLGRSAMTICTHFFNPTIATELEVLCENHRARKFYERAGFRPADTPYNSNQYGNTSQYSMAYRRPPCKKNEADI